MSFYEESFGLVDQIQMKPVSDLSTLSFVSVFDTIDTGYKSGIDTKAEWICLLCGISSSTM